MPPSDEMLVDAVASLTDESGLVDMVGSCGTAHKRPDGDFDVAVLGSSGPLDLEVRTRLVESFA